MIEPGEPEQPTSRVLYPPSAVSSADYPQRFSDTEHAWRTISALTESRCGDLLVNGGLTPTHVEPKKPLLIV